MGSESVGRGFPAQSEPNETAQEIYKQPKISYTRGFLLSLAELDACKNLPSGFDPSILREFDDASNTILEWQRIPGSASLHSFSSGDYGSSQSNRKSDSVRPYGSQYRHSWQNLEHDGLLGSGTIPRVSGFTAGASAPRVQGNGHHLLNRSNEPYRPPRPYKAVPHSGRENNDSYNDETFGSAEYLSQEREEEERRRRASFELMRKEQQNAIFENQKQIADKHIENFDPDIAALLEDSRNDKRLVNESNNSEEAGVPPASNDKSANSSFSAQTVASRPSVPPGFTSRILENTLGTETLTNSPVSKVVNVDLEDNRTCGRTNPIEDIAHDSPDEKQSEKQFNDQQHETKSINVPFINEGERIVIPSSVSDLSDNIVNFDYPSYRASNFSEVYVAQEDEVTDAKDATGDKTMDTSGQDNSTLILEKLFGSSSIVNSRGSSSFIENHDVKADYSKNPLPCSSKFAHWFLEEEKKPAGATSSGNDKSGSQVSGVSDGRVTPHNPQNVCSERKELAYGPMTSVSTSATEGIPKQLHSYNKPPATSGILTCEDLEQSILQEINENSSTQNQSVQGWRVYDKEDEQPNSASDGGLSQHLLSLLHKGASMKDLAASSKLNVGSSDKLRLSEIEINSRVLNKSSKRNTGNSEKNLTLEQIFGTEVTKELESTEASVSIQRGSVGRITRNDVSEPRRFPFLVADNSFFPSAVDGYKSVWANGEAVMASNCAKRNELPKFDKNQSYSDVVRTNIGSNLQQGSKVSPISGFFEKADSTVENCLPEEDSLITVDDPIMPQHSIFMPAGDQIHTDLLNSNTRVSIAEKLASLNAALGDERYTASNLEGRPFPSNSYDVTGSETPYLNLHEQLSYPQLLHPQMNPGRPFFHPLDSRQLQMSSQIKSMIPKTDRHNPSSHRHLPRNVLSSPLQHTHAVPTRFDHPVHHSLSQKIDMAGNYPPHLLNGQPRVVSHPHPINQMACYTQELNPMQSFPLNYKQHNDGGLGMRNLEPGGVSGNKNQAAFNRLIEMELRAKQMQPFPMAGHRQGTVGNLSTWDSGKDNRSIWK